jgi:hypothetical protein
MPGNPTATSRIVTGRGSFAANPGGQADGANILKNCANFRLDSECFSFSSVHISVGVETVTLGGKMGMLLKENDWSQTSVIDASRAQNPCRWLLIMRKRIFRTRGICTTATRGGRFVILDSFGQNGAWFNLR